MSSIVLFRDNKECCGCGACMNICPKSAISMCEDEYGFIYPEINTELCVECGICKQTCGYQNIPEKFKVKAVYAAAAKDDEILKKSASGGAFAVIAKKVLQNRGIVYGVALPLEDGILVPKHMRIDNEGDLVQLQGSKYVQSELGFTYQQVRSDLVNGKYVMFTGTPCQIASLKGYLRADYDNLLTIENICHGVPNKKLFQDFIVFYGKQLGGTLRQFYFRDKSKGQGMVTKSYYVDVAGNQMEKTKVGGSLAYINFFMKSYLYRENCYSCPYATADRSADITLGDFWGFHQEYPNYKESEGLSNGRGISCLLVNTEKGKLAIGRCCDSFIMMESAFEKVAKHNDQLHSPSKCSPKRKIILELYKKGGYEAVDKYFKKNFKKDILKYSISGMIPKGFKRVIMRMIGRVN